MSDFESHGLRAGKWSGLLRADKAPARVVVTHLSEIVATARITDTAEGEWLIEAQLPADSLSEGIHSFVLVADDGEGEEVVRPGAVRLEQLPVLAGSVLADDLIAEIGHMRSELELLKREFRRLASEE